MTRRALLFIFAAGVLLALSLALSNALYYFLALTMAFVLLYSFVSALFSFLTLSALSRALSTSVTRGDTVRLSLAARQKSPLPVAPIAAGYRFGSATGEAALKSGCFSADETVVTFSARHVGAFKTGLSAVSVSDLFGLFRFTKRFGDADTVLVLPRPFEIDKPTFCQGDEGNAALLRTQEDFTSPEDVRAFRPGDAMKRVHWKLSMARRELLVRKYETPAPPDTLIILDCSEAENQEDEEKNAAVRDALCETAVAAARLQMADGSPVRLPLYGERANEFSSDGAGNLTLLQEMLAAQTFRRGEDFSRVLSMELKRMRRTGATIIITTRLTAQVVDAVISIRRMGPSARLYLVGFSFDKEETQPFVARLQHHLVEVCYVTPA